MMLRFDTRNLNGECSRCNRFDTDHLIGYRRNLVHKLGAKAFERSKYNNIEDEEIKSKLIREFGEKQVGRLEAERHSVKKWDVGELKQLYIHFSQMTINLKNGL